jgi:tetratricopeptide (TPR) repeat protein
LIRVFYCGCMSDNRRTNKTPQTKSERELLELRIDSKLAEAKEALRAANQAELKKISEAEHRPKLKRVLSFSGIAIAVLIASNLWAYLGIKDRIKDEAGRIIDQKLIDPQLSNTLDEALSKKAVPYIAAQIHPIETNVAHLIANVDEQTARYRLMALDFTNAQIQLASGLASIHQQIRPLAGTVSSLQTSVDTAQERQVKLENEQKLMALFNRAETFDKDAFQELQSTVRGTNATAPLAKALVDNIRRSLVLSHGERAFLTTTESAGVNQYGGPFTSDEIADKLSLYDGPELEGVINLVADNKLFVPKLVEKLHESKNLWVVDRIEIRLNSMTGKEFVPWDLKAVDLWWSQNMTNYIGWPYDQYGKADWAFHATRYQEALTNFEAVLAIDPAADKSRALAVGCAIEVGDLTKAKQLNVNYAAQGGRWQRWANAKMMLGTNGIQQATEEFVSIAKQYPTFPDSAWIDPRSSILRQIDWPLYSKLMQGTNSPPPASPK